MKNLKSFILFIYLLNSFSAMADVDINKEAHSALFQNISGWMNKGIVLKRRVNLNHATDRALIPSEYNSVEETFKINYAFFINDEDYKCRRPTYYDYFASLTGTKPNEEIECARSYKVTLISESSKNSAPMTEKNINPNRIYQIHYLFAGKGKEMMSRWGHAMYRIVLCAPERKTVGAECLQDYAHHVVVSYRANVEDMNISYAKGIKGAYDSMLFLMNMSEVVDEYTKGEFRDVLSIPLKMTRKEITSFTHKLLENYWGYKGKYYFLTNNCATEAMNLLRTAYPNDNKLQTANIVTPLGLYDFLIKNKFVDISVLNDRKKAISQGYLFPGVSEKLEKSLKLFDDGAVNFEEFALKLTPEERKALYERKLISDKSDLTRLANALRLEEQILLSREQQFASKLGKALFGKEPIPELKNTIVDEKIQEIRLLYKQMTSENIVAMGYGIPLEHEFFSANPENVKRIQQIIRSHMEELKDVAIKFFPKEVAEIKGALENRHWVLTQMSKLK